MNKLIKTQHIFLNSENRSHGTPFDFTIDFPNRYIECEDDEILCITLMNFNVYCSWYNVNNNNNSFSITRVSDNHITTVVLPIGNYPYKLLYQTINYIVGGNICSFNKIKNKFRFTFDELHTLNFINNSYELLGFTNEVHAGTVIESDEVLNPFLLDNICVHVSGVQPYRAYNLDNMTSNDVVISDMLCAIPFVSAPYDMLNWVNTGNQYQMYIYDKNIQKLGFRITDFKNNPLTYIADNTITLRIDTFITYDEDSSLSILQKILEYTKMNFLSKHI